MHCWLSVWLDTDGKEEVELKKKREICIIYYVSPEEEPKNMRMFEIEGTPPSTLLA